MTLRIATIGRSGQTAQALAACAAADPGVSLIQAGAREADLADAASLARFISAARPDVLINTGAYNFVDRAEQEPDLAMRINADGPAALARLTQALGIPFIHMSTDCVFDGASARPYREEDPPCPLSAYGRSKLAGEQAVAALNPGAVTARVCWVYSEYAETFVSKMIALARARREVEVVSDQTGPPTYAPDIARALLRLAHEMHAGAADLPQLFHIAAPLIMDRAAMAQDIMNESARQGGPSAQIRPVLTSHFNAPARRPLNARLDGSAAAARLALSWTDWRQALARSVAGVLARPSP